MTTIQLPTVFNMQVLSAPMT